MHQIVQFFDNLFSSYSATLFESFDTVQDYKSQGFRSHNLHYLYVVLIFLCTFLYGSLCLVLESEPAETVNSLYLQLCVYLQFGFSILSPWQNSQIHLSILKSRKL